MLGIFDFKYSKYLKYLVGPGVSVGVSKCVRIKSPKFQVGFVSRHVFHRSGVPVGAVWVLGGSRIKSPKFQIGFASRHVFPRAGVPGGQGGSWGGELSGSSLRNSN